MTNQKKWLVLIGILLVIGCSKSKDTTPHDPLVDIAIQDSEKQGIICINLNTNPLGGNESPGSSTPKISSPSFLVTPPTPPLLKDLPQQSQMSPMPSPTTIQANASGPLHSIEDNPPTLYSHTNFNDNERTSKEVTRKDESTCCYIYVEKDSPDNLNYDFPALGGTLNAIYAPQTTAFDETPYDVESSETAGHGKIIVYYTSMPNSSTLGYFWSLDFYSDTSITNSNQADILYMNIKFITQPSLFPYTDVNKNLKSHKETFAHELQHLINFSHRFRVANGETPSSFETWLEEGIAEGATRLVVDDLDSFKYLGQPGSGIPNGRGIFKWSSSGYDYALTHMFLEYTRIQCTDSNAIGPFYKNLMESYPNGSGTTALYSVVDTYTHPFMDITDIIASFHMANYINANTGKYGYKQEYTLPKAIPAPINLSLQPGGAGYYSVSGDTLKNFVPASNIGPNTVYYRINKDL